MMAEINEGDRVRVTYELTAGRDGYVYMPMAVRDFTTEVVEPAWDSNQPIGTVRVFGPKSHEPGRVVVKTADQRSPWSILDDPALGGKGLNGYDERACSLNDSVVVGNVFDLVKPKLRDVYVHDDADHAFEVAPDVFWFASTRASAEMQYAQALTHTEAQLLGTSLVDLGPVTIL